MTDFSKSPNLISSATFPDYFIQNKSRKTDIQCRLDLQIFADHFAPAFGITCRYVGEEPLSQVTNQYNQALKAHLPGLGIRVVEKREQPLVGGTDTCGSRSCQGVGFQSLCKEKVKTSLRLYIHPYIHR